MDRFVLTVAIAAALAGCAQDQTRAPAVGAPGSYQEGGTFTRFYGEEVVHGRLFLIGKKSSWIEFQKTHELPVSEMKTYIGKGPTVDGKRMTVVVQTLKDEPAVEARLMATMRERWQIK